MPEYSKLKRLYVEGQDDCFSIINIMERHGINGELFTKKPNPKENFIQKCGGIVELLRIMPDEIRRGYDRLGFVIDSDEDIEKRWKEVKSKFGEIGIISLPEKPNASGTIINGLKKDTKVGIWLMPDNINPGFLENFLSEMISDKDPCWPYAKEVTAKAKKVHNARYRDVAKSKAEVHTWLAWQEEPGLPFGTAIGAKYFKKEPESAKDFVEWFKELYTN